MLRTLVRNLERSLRNLLPSECDARRTWKRTVRVTARCTPPPTQPLNQPGCTHQLLCRTTSRCPSRCRLHQLGVPHCRCINVCISCGCRLRTHERELCESAWGRSKLAVFCIQYR